MKSLKQHLRRLLFALAAAGLLLGLSGCGTVEGDADHVSSRPWNTPKSWEGGLPSGLNEGR